MLIYTAVSQDNNIYEKLYISLGSNADYYITPLDKKYPINVLNITNFAFESKYFA